ncbi:MAG: hypothetical protein V1799_10045 [bacterium]
MKKSLLIFTMMVFSIDIVFSQQVQRGVEYRVALTGTLPTRIKSGNTWIYDQNSIRNEILELIRGAITEWTNASDVITMEYNESGPNIYVEFTDLGSEPGHAPSSSLIYINNWSEWSLSGDPYLYDLQTTILHEFGHLFYVTIGNLDFPSIMYPASRGQTLYLTTTDKANTRNIHNPIYAITLNNSFNDGYMIVDGTTRSIPSGGYEPGWRWNKFPVSVQAIDDQQQSGYTMKFDNWSTPGNLITSMGISIPSVAGTYQANFSEEYDVTVENDFSGGQISVSQSTIVSPSLHNKVRYRNGIAVSAISPQQVDGIQYSFIDWQKNGNTISTNMSNNTFLPTGNDTYTARFSRTPLPPQNVTAVANVGQHMSYNGLPIRIAV